MQYRGWGRKIHKGTQKAFIIQKGKKRSPLPLFVLSTDCNKKKQLKV